MYTVSCWKAISIHYLDNFSGWFNHILTVWLFYLYFLFFIVEVICKRVSSISADNIPTSTHTTAITVNLKRHKMCYFKSNSASGWSSVTLSVSITVVTVAGMTVPVSVICLAFYHRLEVEAMKAFPVLKMLPESWCLSQHPQRAGGFKFIFTAFWKCVVYCYAENNSGLCLQQLFVCFFFFSFFSLDYQANVWETNTVLYNFIVPVRVFSSSWGDPVPLTKC